MTQLMPDQMPAAWLHRIYNAIGTERLTGELERFADWMREEGPPDPLAHLRFPDLPDR